MKDLPLVLTEHHPLTEFSAQTIRKAITVWLTKELTKDACTEFCRSRHYKEILVQRRLSCYHVYEQLRLEGGVTYSLRNLYTAE